MSLRKPIVYLVMVLTFLLGAGVGVVVGQTLPDAPVPAQEPIMLPAPPDYQVPAWRDVLAGTAPLRVLVCSGQSMLAWKGLGVVRAVDARSGAVLYEAKADEMVGLVREPNGAMCSLRQNGKNFCAVPASLRLESNRPIRMWTPQPDNWTSMPGPVVVVPTMDGNFNITRELLLEDYLRAVVPSEMLVSFHPAALRAQAIIARTYTLCKLGRHAAEGADLCATVHCQVFGRDARPRPESDQAVRDTRGLILLAGDAPAETYYSSTCGGTTDDAGLLWGPEYDRPYLVGTLDIDPAHAPTEVTVDSLTASADAYCRSSKSRTWSRAFTSTEVSRMVARNLPLVTGDPTAQIRQVTNLAVEERTEHGRVASLRVEGDGASILVFGDAVRWLFGTGEPGPDGLWSALFDLTTARDTNGRITAYQFRGVGRGHGIGLCQWGANGRARAGQSTRDILRAYFPGTKLSDE